MRRLSVSTPSGPRLLSHLLGRGLGLSLGLGLGLGLVSAHASEPFVFAAEVPVAASVSLWPTGLRSGPTGPLFHNFQAQVLFSGEAAPVRCALRLADPEGQLDPGQSSTLALRCASPFRVRPGEPGFKLLSGTRPLGTGELRAAARAQVMGETAPPSPAPTASTATGVPPTAAPPAAASSPSAS